MALVTDSKRSRRRRTAVAVAVAVAVLWFTLYRTFPTYPPSLGWPLAVAALLFLSALALLYRLHGDMWPGIAKFGFVVSAVGLGLWTVGGTMNALSLRAPGAESLGGRFVVELLGQPQPGWGLLCVGLMPTGLGAIRGRLPLSMRLLLPLGGLLFFGPPLTYLLGARTAGLTVMALFGSGWLVIGALLLSEARASQRQTRPSGSVVS